MPRPRLPLGVLGEVSVQAVADGGYRARARYRDRTGTTRTIERRGGTQTAARAAVRAAFAEVIADGAPEKSTATMTVGRALDSWLTALEVSGTVSPSTITTYRGRAASVRAQFGGLELVELTAMRVGEFLQALASGGRSWQTPRTILTGLLAHAQRQGWVTVNAAQSAPLPVSRRQAGHNITDLSPTEIAAIRAACRAPRQHHGPWMEDLVVIMLATGARISEALALRWRDFDSWAHTITLAGHVDTAAVWLPGRKAGGQTLVVPIPDSVVELLEDRMERVRDTSPDAPIFASRVGGFRQPGNTRRSLRDAMARAGITGFHPHRLRHAVGTAVERGAGIATAQAALGHRYQSTTTGHYVAPQTVVEKSVTRITDALTYTPPPGWELWESEGETWVRWVGEGEPDDDPTPRLPHGFRLSTPGQEWEPQ